MHIFFISSTTLLGAYYKCAQPSDEHETLKGQNSEKITVCFVITSVRPNYREHVSTYLILENTFPYLLISYHNLDFVVLVAYPVRITQIEMLTLDSYLSSSRSIRWISDTIFHFFFNFAFIWFLTVSISNYWINVAKGLITICFWNCVDFVSGNLKFQCQWELHVAPMLNFDILTQCKHACNLRSLAWSLTFNWGSGASEPLITTLMLLYVVPFYREPGKDTYYVIFPRPSLCYGNKWWGIQGSFAWYLLLVLHIYLLLWIQNYDVRYLNVILNNFGQPRRTWTILISSKYL